MTDNKMLQILIDGQVNIRNDIKSLKQEMNKKFEEVNYRLDAQGKSLAYLEDDTPTIKDFKHLEKRVKKIEIKLAM